MVRVIGIFERISFLLQKSLFVFHDHRISFCGIYNKVYKFLVKNFATSIRLEEVSTLVGLTPTAFCRYFKERTKKTFVEYLNEMRIGYSKKLLLENKMKISTISGEVGFPNLSNFISQFKKVTGMSPSQFQKQFGVKAKQAI